MLIISLKNVSKTYHSGSLKVDALKNINIDIEKGELIAIMGPSGSGKSTLLNIIGCLDILSSGNYFINSKDITQLNNKQLAALRNKTFGFIVQYFALINDYTVYENVLIPLEYSKMPRFKRKKKITDTLEKLKISDKTNFMPKELSGGQNQRVAIARAIVNDPDVILADEPTGALDSKTSQEVMNILIDLNNEGKTIIIVTHDYKVAHQCKRIVNIEDGCIVSDNKAISKNYQVKID